MLLLPTLPRWQQYVLLAGAVLATVTCIALRLVGHGLGAGLAPLSLPFQLWWPLPAISQLRVYWWLMLLLLGSIDLGLLWTSGRVLAAASQ